ncbi:MAG: chemotaxis protein CheC [Magnetospirillum sp. WYHS-4]
MDDLTEFQHAAITEMLNIAIGKSAAALNALVDEEVTLSVPEVIFTTCGEAARMIEKQAGSVACAVMQEFVGAFSGNAMLIFPEAKSLALVRLMIGEAVPLESLTELEQEALTEVGNIVLNASLGTLANLLGLEIDSSLPVYLSGTGSAILQDAVGKCADSDWALLVEVDFELKKSNIDGYVLLMLDVASAQRFGDLVDAYVKNFMS